MLLLRRNVSFDLFCLDSLLNFLCFVCLLWFLSVTFLAKMGVGAFADELVQGRLHYVERCPQTAARAHVEEEGWVGVGVGMWG